MIRDRDIAPLIRSWLRDGLDDSAERVLDAALAIVDTTPQRPAARWLARRIDMNLIVRLGVAAAVLAMAVALGYGILQNVGDVAPDPEPSDGTNSAGAELPAELRRLFLGSPRVVEELGNPVVTIDMTAGVLQAGRASSMTELTSAVSMTESGAVRFETVVDGTGCEVGDVGTYSYALSRAGSLLSFANGSDACAARAAVLDGDWKLMDCPDSSNWCLGTLVAGSQTALFFDPYSDRATGEPSRYEVLSYEVPSGWLNAHDWIDLHTIMRADGYDEHSVDCLDCPDGIWFGAAPMAAAPDCVDDPDPEIGTSAQALADWLRTHPGLDVTDGPPLAVDGRQAIVLDVSAPEGFEDACPEAEFDATFVPLFTHAGYDFGIRTGDRHRLILVEVDEEFAMLIGIDSFDPEGLDALIVETEPIVESIRLAAP